MTTATISGARAERAAAATGRIVPTVAAWRALGGMCRAEGRVVLVHAPADGDPTCPGELLCFGERDYVPGPHEVRLAEVCGCAVYVDRRHALTGHLLRIDLSCDPAEDGPTFLLRGMPAPPADKDGNVDGSHEPAGGFR